MSNEQSAAPYIKKPLERGAMISICDKNTDKVLATAKTPELALVIKKKQLRATRSATTNKNRKFSQFASRSLSVSLNTAEHRLEASVMETSKEERNRKLVKGQDFTAEVHGKLIIVKDAEHTVEQLKARKALSRVEKIKKPAKKNPGE